jgi:hypothetical protein
VVGAAAGGAVDATAVAVVCAVAAFFFGGGFLTAAFLACWLAVAEGVVVSPAGLPPAGPHELVATMTTSATKASSPVSALRRAGHDFPR